MKSHSTLLCIGLLFQAGLASLQAHTDHSHELVHWEKASAHPDRMFLSFNGDPDTSRAVSWRTSTAIAAGFAEIAEATKNSDFAKSATRLPALTETVDLNTATLNTQGVVNYHSVIFDGLKPETLYAYRVGDGGERWSEWIQFRTAQTDFAPFKFVYFGDAQNDVLSHWSRVLRMAYKTAPDAEFAVHAGDLINRAQSDYEWAEWFKAGGWLHATWTGVPVAGNHEYGQLRHGVDGEKWELTNTWRNQFSLPVEETLPQQLHETTYSFTYQGVLFIVLNSNKEVSAQTPWLEAQLAGSEALWKVVVFHHPIFSPREQRDNDTLRAEWKPILEKYKVDLVLQGHDHSYARGHVPVKTAEGPFEKDSFETLYVTSVSGPKMYPQSRDKLDSYNEAHAYTSDRMAQWTQFFQVIEIDGGRLEYNAYNVLGEHFDRAVITKDLNTGAKSLSE